MGSQKKNTMHTDSKLFRYIYYHLPWQLMVIVLFGLSSVSGRDLSQYTFNVSDKLIHFLVFGLLGIMMFRSFRVVANTTIRRNAYLMAIITAGVYGALDEIHQLYVPGRFASIGDWIADILGIIVMIFLYNLVVNRFEKGQNTGNLESTGR